MNTVQTYWWFWCALAAYLLIGLLGSRWWWRRKWRLHNPGRYTVDTSDWVYIAVCIVTCWPVMLLIQPIVRVVTWFFNTSFKKTGGP